MANKFWVGGTGTWDAADTTHWDDADGGAGGDAVPGTSDVAVFNANSGGGTVTVNVNVAVQSITFGAFAGTIDFGTNNNTVALTVGLNGSGTGVRTLITGTGQWTLTALTGGVIDFTTATNFTLTNTGWNVLLAAPTGPTGDRTITGGAKTIPTLTVNDAIMRQTRIVLNNVTIGTLVPTSMRRLTVTGGSSATITNGFTWTGTASAPIFLESSTFSNATLNVGGTCVLEWANFTWLTKGGAGTITGNNSFDLLATSGITVNNPSVGGGGVVARVVGA